MDSFSQFILGAAVGEVVIGKKIGNRAMLMGGLAGTIPDLDIIANFVTDEITALAFHRGITHSLFFAVTFPALLGYLVHKYYGSGIHRRFSAKVVTYVCWLLFCSVFAFGINFIASQITQGIHYPTLLITASVIIALAFILWRTYVKKELESVNVTFKDWYWLFFWAIITHPLLDCCTVYGTQLFQPFWDYRVAFNNVSVADPLYTTPFLICLTIAAILMRNNPYRSLINWLGIILSTCYLGWGFYNKSKVNKVFENSFAERQITYSRYMTGPTILNNFLWIGVAEGDTAFYQGEYSILDKEPTLKFVNVYPKRHHLIEPYLENEDLKTLQWFTKEYYSITPREDGVLQLNDLRYGVFGKEKGDEQDFVFKFLLEPTEDGLSVKQAGNPGRDKAGEAFGQLIDRIKGI